MPSIIPSYVYTLFASIIIGTIVIAACGLITANIKAQAETQQLRSVINYVATKSMDVVSSPLVGSIEVNVTLDLPQAIGNQRYWLQIYNDTTGAWIQGGLGINVVSSEQQVSLPADIEASGVYVSGVGNPTLQYQSNSTGSYLTLSGGN